MRRGRGTARRFALWAALTAVSLDARAIAEPAGAPDDSREREARALYDRGARHYNLGEFDAAIEDFRASYRLSDVPSLLFNLAQAYRQKGRGSCGEALQFYRSYLRQKPDAVDRATVELRIEEMEGCARAVERERESTLPARSIPPPATVPAPTGTVAAPPVAVGLELPAVRTALSTSAKGQLALAGVGVAVAAGGGLLYGLAVRQFSSLSLECPCPRERWQPWQETERAGYALLAIGASTAAAALIWWLARPSAKRTPQRAAAR